MSFLDASTLVFDLWNFLSTEGNVTFIGSDPTALSFLGSRVATQCNALLHLGRNSNSVHDIDGEPPAQHKVTEDCLGAEGKERSDDPLL